MSSSTFILSDHETWTARFFDVMGDIVTETVIEKVRQNPPEFFSCEDCEWLDNFIVHDGADVRSVLMDRFSEGWSVVRAFHACRPNVPDSYHRNGLKPQTVSDYKATALARGVQLGIPADEVRAASDQFDWGQYAGSVFFCLRYDWLVDQFNHCWKFGSEGIYGLLQPICPTDVLKRFTKESGNPVILECDVPGAMLYTGSLQYLCGLIIAGSIQYRLNRNWVPESERASIEIRSTLPPGCIIKWHDPTAQQCWRAASVDME